MKTKPTAGTGQVTVALPAELRIYLQERATQGFRSLSSEIAMRLSQSREQDAKATQSKGARSATT